MASVSGHECVDPFRRLIDLQITYLRSCGLWQISPSNSWFLRWAYFGYKIFMLATMHVFMITVFADIWSNIDNMAITTDGGCILAGMVVVTFKSMNYQIRRGKIKRLLEDMFKCTDDLCLFSSIDCIREITKKYHLRNQLILHGFSGVGCVLAIALLFFSPMENGLPIRAKYPFDTTTSPWRLVGLAVETVAVSGGLIAIVSMDSLMTLINSMLSMQFDILNVHFENRIEQTNNTVYKERNHDDTSHVKKKAGDSFLRRYKACLRFHQRLVVVTNDFNKTYSLSMFVQMLSSTSMICLTGFQAIVVGGQSSDIIKFGIYLNAAVSQLLYICWLGNELNYSSSVSDRSQWLSDWHHQHLPDIALTFMLATMFTRQSMELKAGPFYILSLQTFIMIIRRSYSVFALLNNVHSGNL